MANPTYATRSYTVAPGSSVQVVRHSDFLTCLEASASFKVSFDNQPRTDFEAGITYRTEGGFTLVEIINESAEPLTVKLGFGRGNVTDARNVITGSVDVSGSEIKVASPSDFIALAPVSIAAGTSAQIFFADARRVECGMKNIGTDRVWISSQNSTLAIGHPLDPGETLVLTTSDGLGAYSPDADALIALWSILK
jgi:hypothetical protein